MIPNEIIKRSIKGGYYKDKILKCLGNSKDTWGYFTMTNHGPVFSVVSKFEMVLDPEFWRCLGIAQKWAYKLRSPHNDGDDGTDEWEARADQFWHLVMHRGDSEGYWKGVADLNKS